MSETIPIRHPMAILMNLIITLLTPMFLAAAGNNLELARQAAAETLNAYRAETQADMITVAKIVAFGLAALATLSRSMAEDLPLETILRLHASANASDRSEHRNRQTLQTQPVAPSTAAPEPEHRRGRPDRGRRRNEGPHRREPGAVHQAGLDRTRPETRPDPQAHPTVTDQERRYQATWAASAAAIAAETPPPCQTLPPEERALSRHLDRGAERLRQGLHGRQPAAPPPARRPRRQ